MVRRWSRRRQDANSRGLDPPALVPTLPKRPPGGSLAIPLGRLSLQPRLHPCLHTRVAIAYRGAADSDGAAEEAS